MADVSPPRTQRRGGGKLALLFMVTSGPNNPGIWRRWLTGASPDRYSFHVHAKFPNLVIDPLFGPGRIKDVVPTEWGTVSLVQAHLALLREGLKDPENR